MGRWGFISGQHSYMELEVAFSDYQFPLCIFNNCYNIISQNFAFKKIHITPNECQKLCDLSKIERNGDSYLVRIKKIEYCDEDFFLYIFQGLKYFKDSLSHKEREILFKNENNDLEIVTSSMAHELNNPIAGILGAIELLELELGPDSNDHYISQDILEMKKSAKRCKDLIQIFLGFSRNDFNFKKNVLDKCFIEVLNDTSQKAIELLRPRMLESNINISLKLNIDHHPDLDIVIYKSHIGALTLFFYFLLNEAIIYISHQRLIIQVPIEKKQVFEWELKVQFKNEGEGHKIVITLFYDSSIETFRRLCDSKLFQYLLKKINLSLEKVLLEDTLRRPLEKNNLTFFYQV